MENQDTITESLESTVEKLSGNFPPELKVDNYNKIGEFDLNKLKVDVVSSGFKVFDKHLVIKKNRPQLITIAAYTSHGKTAMLMQIAAEVSRTGPVFVHSFEMDESQLETRLLASFSSVSAENIKKGNISVNKLEKAISEYKKRKLYLCKDPNSHLLFVQTSCFEKAKEVGNPSLIVVDYVQIMDGPMDRSQKTREISDIMKGLKSLAVTLNCPILMGAQLNRNCEQRGKSVEMLKGVGEYRPITSDLADSSAIAHDSDVLIFITRQEQYDGTRQNKADILCAKNRDGKTFEAEFQWSGEICSFSEEEDRTNVVNLEAYEKSF